MPPIPPPRVDGRTTTTPVPLYWAKYGSGGAGPVVVLHGGPAASHEYLLPQMLALGDRRELLFYDQRGGGRSRTDDPSPITWRTQVEDLAALVRELSIEPLEIVGYSWGGLLAALYLMESHRDARVPKITRLALIDPAPINRGYRDMFNAEFERRQRSAQVEAMREEVATSGLRERNVAAYRQRMFELSVAGYFFDPRNARDLTPFRIIGKVQQSVWDSLDDYDLSAPGELDAVVPPPPTLVVHGRQDPIPLASSEAYARCVGASLEVIDRCGHVPYVEQPDALFGALERFL